MFGFGLDLASASQFFGVTILIVYAGGGIC